jgi:hypothetical protein
LSLLSIARMSRTTFLWTFPVSPATSRPDIVSGIGRQVWVRYPLDIGRISTGSLSAITAI